MKTQLKKYFGVLLLGLSFIAFPTHAKDENINTVISATELQAAIEAFGVPSEQAKEATEHSAILIEEEKRATDKNYQDMLIVSDDFFTLTPF